MLNDVCGLVNHKERGHMGHVGNYFYEGLLTSTTVLPTVVTGLNKHQKGRMPTILKNRLIVVAVQG